LVLGISFFPEIGTPTFNFLDYIISLSGQKVMETTLLYSLGHATLAVTMAAIYAWIVARTDLPAKRIFELLPVLALTLPLVVKAFAWTFLLNPASGILNILSETLFGPNAPTFNVNSFPGLLLVSSVGGVPLAYLILLPAMRSIDSSFEEASRLAGHSTLATTLAIDIRLLLPAIGSAFLLAVVGGLNNFDYPYIIGNPAGIHTLSTEVYYYASLRSPPSFGDSGNIGIIYMATTLIGVTLYIWLTRKTYRFAAITGKGARQVPLKLKKLKVVAVFVCVAILFMEFILPFAAILLVATSNVYVTGSLTHLNWDLQSNFIKASQIPLFYQSLYTTLEMAIVTAIAGTSIGAILSFVSFKSKTRGARLAEYISALPLTVPNTVYSIALFWMFLLLPGVNKLYGTIFPLVIALIFIRLPQATRIISGNLVQVSNELEEASQVAGSRFSRTFFRISMPLVKNALINSVIYYLVDSLRELGAVIILATPAATAFTVMLLGYYNSNTLAEGVVAAGSVMLTLIVMAFLTALQVTQYLLGRKSRS